MTFNFNMFRFNGNLDGRFAGGGGDDPVTGANYFIAPLM